MSDDVPMTVEQALADLNGWFRWSSWAAHWFVDGVQSCATVHGQFMGGGFVPKRPTAAFINERSGVPYGKVCSRCTKLRKAVR